MFGGNCTFGVCNYDFDAYESKIKDLEQFVDYDAAFSRYMERLNIADKHGCLVNDDLWLVYIDDENRITQFEQLDWKAKCKLVELDK